MIRRWWHRVRRYYGFEARYHPGCEFVCQYADDLGMLPEWSCARRCLYLDHADYV